MENASRGGIALVGFDADDTLWRSQDYFDEAQAQFERIISRYVDLADVGRRLYGYEARNIAFFGYGVKGMALSMVEAAVEITDERIAATDIKRIVALAKELLRHPVELLDGVREAVEAPGAKGAVWRTDPAQSGLGGATGDIGTHAFNLASFVTGLTLDSLAADLDSFVEGRRLDDNAHVMLRFEGGAKGMLWCSQVAPGNENALRLRVYGTKGGIEWAQEDPNYLWFTPFGEQKRLITRGGAGVGSAAARVTRVPAGHPEGYLEAFATIYSEAANAIEAHRNGKKPDSAVIYPSVDDGLKGVAFIDACVRSSQKNGGWVKL